MKNVILSIFILVLLAVGTGFYFKWFTEQGHTGDIIIGISVLVSSFIMMPLFLYHRWKGKRLEDYTLTKKNMDKMQDRGID
jgi:uncharacterized protein YxeA